MSTVVDFLEEITYFTPQQLASLSADLIPHHVAFIPDGNRRWARQHQEKSLRGHQEGADILMDVVRACKQIGIKTATFYAFSTENWRRTPEEVEGLMWILEHYLADNLATMLQNNVALHVIGDVTKVPVSLQNAIAHTHALTSHCDGVNLVLAINYGARDEICRAVQKYMQSGQSAETITPELLHPHFDTAPFGDPELLIRTSGEQRISNFLLWQLSYTEIYVTDLLWPDFNPHHLLEAIASYQRRNRREGK